MIYIYTRNHALAYANALFPTGYRGDPGDQPGILVSEPKIVILDPQMKF